MDPSQIVAWAAPIAATLATAAGQLALNSRFKQADERREMARQETAEKREREAEWRERIEECVERQDAKLDAITNATQTTMRTTLLHYIEKYLERGWMTPEERAAIADMHQKYAALNANGLIDGYMARVMDLPDKEI